MRPSSWNNAATGRTARKAGRLRTRASIRISSRVYNCTQASSAAGGSSACHTTGMLPNRNPRPRSKSFLNSAGASGFIVRSAARPAKLRAVNDERPTHNGIRRFVRFPRHVRYISDEPHDGWTC